MDIGFGAVEACGDPEGEGDRSLTAVGSRKKGRRETRDSKKGNSFNFSVKESRVTGEVGQKRVKMGYNYIIFVLSHFLTLMMYNKRV